MLECSRSHGGGFLSVLLGFGTAGSLSRPIAAAESCCFDRWFLIKCEEGPPHVPGTRRAHKGPRSLMGYFNLLHLRLNIH